MAEITNFEFFDKSEVFLSDANGYYNFNRKPLHITKEMIENGLWIKGELYTAGLYAYKGKISDASEIYEYDIDPVFRLFETGNYRFDDYVNLLDVPAGEFTLRDRIESTGTYDYTLTYPYGLDCPELNNGGLYYYTKEFKDNITKVEVSLDDGKTYGVLFMKERGPFNVNAHALNLDSIEFTGENEEIALEVGYNIGWEFRSSPYAYLSVYDTDGFVAGYQREDTNTLVLYLTDSGKSMFRSYNWTSSLTITVTPNTDEDIEITNDYFFINVSFSGGGNSGGEETYGFCWVCDRSISGISGGGLCEEHGGYWCCEHGNWHSPDDYCTCGGSGDEDHGNDVQCWNCGEWVKPGDVCSCGQTHGH